MKRDGPVSCIRLLGRSFRGSKINEEISCNTQRWVKSEAMKTMNGELEIKERWFRGRKIDRRGDKLCDDGKCAGNGDAIPCAVCGKPHEVSFEIFPKSRSVMLLVGQKCMGYVLDESRKFAR